MKKNTERVTCTLSGLLVCALICSFFASCGGGGTTPAVTTAAESAATEATAPAVTEPEFKLPEKDWEGRKYRVLGYAAPVYTQFSNFEIDADSMTGEVVNDAVFLRNSTIEARYNVEIVQTLDSSVNDGARATVPVLTNLVSAGEDLYETVFMPLSSVGSVIRGGMLYDLNAVDYIDMEKPWWNQTVRRDLDLGGKLFAQASDFSLRDKNRAYIIIYNSDMLKDFNLDPIVPLVREGKWTIDVFSEYAEKVAADLNGNGENDAEDRYGLGLDSNHGFQALVVGCDVSILDNDGASLTIPENTEHTVSAIDKVLKIMVQKNVAFINQDWQGKVSYDFNSVGTTLFNAGQLLFTTSFPHSLKTRSANSKDEYAIAPFPKYDEKQTGYYTYADVYCMLFGIPVTTKVPDFAGFMLEALSHESTDTTLKAYYDITCKLKYTYDPDSAEMLDIAFRGLRFEPAVMYNISGRDMIREIGTSKVNNFATALASNRRVILADIEALAEDMKKAG